VHGGDKRGGARAVALLPRMIQPWKQGFDERLKTARRPPVLGEDVGGASGLGESASGDVGGCQMAQRSRTLVLGEE
jgi:hypothetical protein